MNGMRMDRACMCSLRSCVPRRVHVVLVLLLLLLLPLPACTTLADRIAEPRSQPLLDAAFVTELEAQLGIEHQRFRPVTGPELEYRVVAPRAYGMEYRYARTATGASFDFHVSKPRELEPRAARGTVVLLHGWGMEGTSMLPWSLALAEHGWRGIVIDLRNHGASERAPAGFGPREGADVAALIASLSGSGNIEGPLVLFGVSYGAVAALYAAAELQDPVVDSVIAISPYANAADGIRGMVDGIRAMHASGLRGRIAASFVRRRYDDAAIDSAIEVAQRRLGLDLESIDVREAVAAVRACTLLLHGTEDGFFPMAAVQSLAEAAPRAQLVALRDEHHFSVPMRVDWLAKPLAQWMAAGTAVGCPNLQLPPPPLPAAS